eukprot:jgi/Tetstr1/427940/TSEL_018015.t1
MQHKAGYWLCNCLPSEVEAFAEAVDATVLAEVERVLGVSFDPSTYGTDTNPVVTDFLAELLHDPNPMAAELGSVLGGGSFNATSSARRYDHFLNDAHGSDSYAAEMREAWGSLQAATACHLGDAARDAAWHITEPGTEGPLRDIMDISEYTGMVFGTVGEVSKGCGAGARYRMLGCGIGVPSHRGHSVHHPGLTRRALLRKEISSRS